MAKTGIEWTEATWNPIVGCSVVSPGCTNCYAMTMAARLEAMGTLPHYAGTTQKTKAGPVWTGKLALAPEATLLAPLRRRKPTTWFVNSMGDLFHDDVPDGWIDRVFAVMALTPQHTYQILTKRSARMRRYMAERSDLILDADGEGGGPIVRAIIALAEQERRSIPIALSHVNPTQGRWPLRNVWLGVSAEDQRRADERIPDLLATPAAIRFVSAEPLLGPIDFAKLRPDGIKFTLNALTGEGRHLFGFAGQTSKLDCIIAGGENGPRPMQADWARSIRDQCAVAGTAFFFKQWGTHLPAGQAMADGRLWAPEGGTVLRGVKSLTGRFLDGVEHDAMPAVAP